MKRVLLAVVMLAFAFAAPAHARWKAQYANASPVVRDFFEGSRSTCPNAPGGGSCCGSADGHPYFGGYTPNADGSVTVELDGIKRTVPSCAVILQPNPTGHAVIWYNIQRDSETNRARVGEIYCFAPGTGS